MGFLISSLVVFGFLMGEVLASTHGNLPTIATVTKVRGAVTKLPPSSLVATAVENGDQLAEDTSIVTGPQSFVKIKFIDNSELTMGPESKIVIAEMAAQTPGVISLLKGKIRTEVQKAETKTANVAQKNKFYIRTRTAAMGVRGTDFQTIYNPDNHVTSLLTFKGAVAMARLDESTHESFETSVERQGTVVVRNDQTNAPELKKIPGKAMDEAGELNKILTEKDAVIVPPGQNSMSSSNLKNVTEPVKISPVQFNALFKNRDLNEKDPVNFKAASDLSETKILVAQANQVVPPEGINTRNKFAPRAGGFIDQQTGMYIAPTKGSSFDDSHGVFVAKNNGEVDADTGQYLPPKGLVLDAKTGFSIDGKVQERPELLALREDMNEASKHDYIVGNVDSPKVVATRTLKEKFIRHGLSFSLGGSNDEIKINDGVSDRTPYTAKSDSSLRFAVEWQVSSTNRFAPLVGLSYASVEFDSIRDNGHVQDTKSLLGMMVGVKYALTDRADLITKIVLDQAHHTDQASLSPDVYQFKRIVITKLNVGGRFEIARSNDLSLMGEGFGYYGFKKKFNNLTVSGVKGFNLKLSPEYRLDEKKSISMGLYFDHEMVDLANLVATNEEKRMRTGIEFKFNLSL